MILSRTLPPMLNAAELESAIMDLRGDAALLDMAVETVLDPGNLARPEIMAVPTCYALPHFECRVLRKQDIEALGRAAENVRATIAKLSADFYGPDKAD
jgi:hypothetical protein